MDVQVKGGFKTVMSWKGKGEVEYLWDVREEGLFQFPPLERYGSFLLVISCHACMVSRYSIYLQSYLQPYKVLTTRNYLKTLLVERSQRSLMMHGLNNWMQDILIYERYTALENMGLQ